MELWVMGLIALGSIAAGILVGFLLIRAIKMQKKRNVIEPNIVRISNPGPFKPKSPQDGTLEMLMQNHNNTLKQPAQTEVTKRIDTGDPKNESQYLVPKQTSKTEISESVENINREPSPAIKREHSNKAETIKLTETNSQTNVAIAHGRKRVSKPIAPRESKLIGEKIVPISREEKITSGVNATVVSESIKGDNLPIPAELKKPQLTDFINELETNLTIATTPWANRLIPFQTRFWDSTHGQDEQLLINQQKELIQLYVDIGLANNIVWLATEIGHRSSDLDESYIKLCSSIADRLKRIFSSTSGST